MVPDRIGQTADRRRCTDVPLLLEKSLSGVERDQTCRRATFVRDGKKVSSGKDILDMSVSAFGDGALSGEKSLMDRQIRPSSLLACHFPKTLQDEPVGMTHATGQPSADQWS